MSLIEEFSFPLENPAQTDGLKFHVREFAEMIEGAPGPGDLQRSAPGVYRSPGRGVSGESSN